MKINGWDIASADARQWNVTPGFQSISNSSEWARGHPEPVLFGSTTGFKSLKITLLIKADRDRQKILSRCSEILSRLLEPVYLELDGFEHRFYGVLVKHSLEENPLGVPFVQYNRASKLTLEINCYEYGEEEAKVGSGATELVIQNLGNVLTPAIIEITPQIGAASITVTGICRNTDTGEDLPVTVRNLETGKTVILDGESGLFTQDSELKAADIDIWSVPTLLPGQNKITINNDRMDVVVHFRPRFM